MKRLIRLENTFFGFSSFDEEEVDKILEFNPESGELKVHILNKPQRIPLTAEKEEKIKFLERAIGKKFDPEEVRIIHRPPIKNAYSAPFKIYLDITTECQLHCAFCLSDPKEKAPMSLPFHIIQRIATEAKELGVMYIKIGGGDPLLHPDFEKIIRTLRSAGCFLTMSTNSVTMTPKIAKLLATANVRTSVSIEGMEKTNDSFRGKGHFRKALETLEMLKSAGVNTLLRVTLLRQNLREVPQLVELAKKYGVKIKFSYCRPAGRAVQNQMVLGPGDAKEYLKVIKYLNSPEVLPYVLMDEGMMLHQPKEIGDRLLRGRMCGAANRSMHIDPYGKVSPCIFLGPTFSAGKIYQDGTIEEFWKGKVGNKFQVIREIPQPKECDACPRLCKNECPANRLYFWGDFEKQDPNCYFEAIRNATIFK